jgi:protein tyrosine phosphatase (PTP) superfamily phosphohydrolase (DUF442 family)
LLAGCLTGGLLAVALQAVLLVGRNNFHVVLPGRVYRCAQPSIADLKEAIQRHGIRTVINLRGLCPDQDWYLDEARMTQQAGVSLTDIGFSAGRLPPVHELRYLLQVLDRCDYPILVHCRQGVDRTGLTSALALLLYSDISLDAALRQLGLNYGHVPVGRTGFMERFFDLYRTWLRATGRTHSPQTIRHWIEEEYCAGDCSDSLEPLDVPYHVELGRPWAARFRAYNTSVQPWRMRPGTSAGVHMGYLLIDAQSTCVAMGRAGLQAAIVPPGQGIDITVALPALHAPGKYTLLVDMVDEQQGWFYQHGAEPLEWPIVVDAPTCASASGGR